tara:strand:- start:8329 stop:8907 length:579 start_codon:yes stop_codon:yes gene_type:complete
MKSTTTGITKLLYPWVQTISIKGIINDIKLIPIFYKINDFRDKNKKGHIQINYIDDIPIVISAEPNPINDTRRKKVPSTLLKNSIDPVTSIISLGILSINGCNNLIPIFDGRRRFDLEYKTAESKEESLLCNLKIKRIAGYSKKELRKHPKEGTIKLKILPGSNSFFFPTEVKIPLTIGSFYVKLNANLVLQ